MRGASKRVWITRRISLGKRQYEYDLDIEALVSRRTSGDTGTIYEVGSYDIQIMRGSKIVKDKRAEVIEKRFYQEYKTLLDDINNLLIEASF